MVKSASASRGQYSQAVILGIRRHTVRLGWIVFGFSVLINLLLLVSPIYMLQIYDRVLASGSGETLFYLTLVAIGLLGALGALEHYRSLILVRFGEQVSNALDQRLFKGVTRALGLATTGNPTQPMRDLDTVNGFLGGTGPANLMDAPWAPLFIGLIYFMHPLLGVVATLGAVALLILVFLTEFLSREPLRKAHEARNKSMQFVDTTARNAPVILALGMGGRMLSRWLTPYREAGEHQAVASERNGSVRAFIKFLRPSLQAAMLGTGAYLALRQEITPGVIVAASIISGRALAPIEQAMGSWKQIIAARDAYHRLLSFLTKHCPDTEQKVTLPVPTGALAAEAITGGPPGTRSMVLKGVSFSIPPGSFLGIAGPSGAGKSTLANMLIGIWQPLGGAVRLDGANIAKWDKEDLGPHLGFLPQDTELFDGTVAQNIARFGDIDSNAVLEAAKLAGVHEFILRLEEGYETALGPNGMWLSAGQRQRINLARAIYGQPKLLVLDEPNSHLDATGEAALLETLKAMKTRGTTTILICHRPTLLALSDQILILREGRVDAYGPPQDILGKGKAAPQTTRGAIKPAPVPAHGSGKAVVGGTP